MPKHLQHNSCVLSHSHMATMENKRGEKRKQEIFLSYEKNSLSEDIVFTLFAFNLRNLISVLGATILKKISNNHWNSFLNWSIVLTLKVVTFFRWKINSKVPLNFWDATWALSWLLSKDGHLIHLKVLTGRKIRLFCHSFILKKQDVPYLRRKKFVNIPYKNIVHAYVSCV